jgi:hypothetical protein
MSMVFEEIKSDEDIIEIDTLKNSIKKYIKFEV